MSPDLRVMLSPSSAYRALALQAGGATRRTALARPLLVAVVLGCAMAITATGRITIGLALSSIFCWSFVPVLQMLTGWRVLRPYSGELGPAARMHLWFLGHAPWSLWLLACAATLTWSAETTRIERLVAATALIPAFWTGVITFAFCRTVLHAPRPRALRRAIGHQVVTLGVVVAYVFIVARPWARLLGIVRL